MARFAIGLPGRTAQVPTTCRGNGKGIRREIPKTSQDMRTSTRRAYFRLYKGPQESARAQCSARTSLRTGCEDVESCRRPRLRRRAVGERKKDGGGGSSATDRAKAEERRISVDVLGDVLSVLGVLSNVPERSRGKAKGEIEHPATAKRYLKKWQRGNSPHGRNNDGEDPPKI